MVKGKMVNLKKGALHNCAKLSILDLPFSGLPLAVGLGRGEIGEKLKRILVRTHHSTGGVPQGFRFCYLAHPRTQGRHGRVKAKMVPIKAQHSLGAAVACLGNALAQKGSRFIPTEVLVLKTPDFGHFELAIGLRPTHWDENWIGLVTASLARQWPRKPLAVDFASIQISPTPIDFGLLTVDFCSRWCSGCLD